MQNYENQSQGNVGTTEVDPATTGLNEMDAQVQAGGVARSDKLQTFNQQQVDEMNKLNVKEIKNVSGTEIIISDLKTDLADDVAFSMKPNEIVDIAAIYEPRQINRSRRLREALAIKRDNGSPKFLAIVSTVSHPDNRVDVPDYVLPTLAEQHKGEREFVAPLNEFDERYEKVIADEEKRNESTQSEARRGRDNR